MTEGSPIEMRGLPRGEEATRELIRQVKHNCDISDARFWGYYSICGLLTRLRELYISEHALMPWDTIPKAEMAEWIHERETLWKELEDEDLMRISIGGESYDPLDADCLNHALKDSGLYYGSGYAAFGKQTFFLATLKSSKQCYDYPVYFTAQEFCRDLTAFPAMLQGRCISIRLESIRTLIWDKFQEFRARHFSGALEAMFSRYGLKRTDPLSGELVRRIDVMTGEIADLFVMHETGEAYEDEHADQWLAIIMQRLDMACEFSLRATKDILADTSEMGPLRAIIRRQDRTLLVSYVALLDGMRKEMFPEIRNAFQHFLDSGDWGLIEKARLSGYERSRIMQEQILDLWINSGEKAGFEAGVKRYLAGIFPK